MTSPLLLAAALLAAPSSERCRPPLVMLTGSDKAFAVRFAAGTPRRRQMEDNIRTAFKSACGSGLLKGATIATLNGVSTRRLFLENQAHANVATLEADQRADGSWRLILGYPFVAADRTVNVPRPAQIQEAIHCAVCGANQREQAESGRCLVD